MKLLLILLFTMSSLVFAVKYVYKKYEKFDFDSIDVSGNQSSPGDLSISPRFQKRFRNKIPERKNFNKEMKRALDSLR